MDFYCYNFLVGSLLVGLSIILKKWLEGLLDRQTPKLIDRKPTVNSKKLSLLRQRQPPNINACAPEVQDYINSLLGKLRQQDSKLSELEARIPEKNWTLEVLQRKLDAKCGALEATRREAAEKESIARSYRKWVQGLQAILVKKEKTLAEKDALVRSLEEQNAAIQARIIAAQELLAAQNQMQEKLNHSTNSKEAEL